MKTPVPAEKEKRPPESLESLLLRDLRAWQAAKEAIARAKG